MEVTVEQTSGLERKLRVQVEEDRVRGEVDKRIDRMAQTANVPGFRPGKVPKKVIQQRFGRQVRDEVVGEIVQSSFNDAVTQEKLRLAGIPTIDPVEAEPGNGVAYTAVFDVIPEISLPPVESLEISRPVSEVAETDIDNMLETLRRQRRTWRVVERPAQPGDRVNIDFEGTVDGETVDSLKGREMAVELGMGWMIDGFEEGLEGTSAGAETTLDLQFPGNYRVENLAGKPVSFSVTVHRVEEPLLPEVDEDFAREFGITEGGVEALRREIRANMERELNDALRTLTKERVMDALIAGDAMDLPESMVHDEVHRLMDRRRAELEQGGLDPAQAGLSHEMFEADARRRVGLGLVLGELIRSNDLTPDPERVRARIETIASTYEDANEVISWYYSNRERLSDIESSVLEDQVVEWIIERARITDVSMTFDEVLNPRRGAAAG